jgi:predicted CXXCH cytochrome family protein
MPRGPDGPLLQRHPRPAQDRRREGGRHRLRGLPRPGKPARRVRRQGRHDRQPPQVARGLLPVPPRQARRVQPPAHAPGPRRQGELRGLPRRPQGQFDPRRRRPLSAATETCIRCHTQQAGPYTYPHGAIREEGCTACHNPHGTVNDKMLVARDANLCMRCHLPPSPPDSTSAGSRTAPTPPPSAPGSPRAPAGPPAATRMSTAPT